LKGVEVSLDHFLVADSKLLVTDDPFKLEIRFENYFKWVLGAKNELRESFNEIRPCVLVRDGKEKRGSEICVGDIDHWEADTTKN